MNFTTSLKKQEQEKEPSPRAIQKLEKYFNVRIKLLNYFFKQIPLHVRNTETVDAYSDVYAILNNGLQRCRENHKYQSYELTFLKQYQNDLQNFCEKCRQIIKISQNMSAQDYIEYVLEWVNKYTRFMHWTYKTFMIIEKNALYVKGTTLYYEGLKIFKNNLIEPIYEDLFAAIYSCLELYKEGELKSSVSLQEIILTIGSAGLRKHRYIKLEKQNERFVFTSKPKAGQQFKNHNQKGQKTQDAQTEENPFETDFFKRHFTNKLAKKLRTKYSEIVQNIIKLSTPQYVDKALKYLKKEEEMVDLFYQNKNVKTIIIRVLDEVLAHNNAEELIRKEKTGLYAMLQKQQLTNAKKLLQLIKRSSNFKLFTKEYQRFIEIKGSQIVDKVTADDEKTAKKEIVHQMIEDLYKLNELIERISSEVASDDTEIQLSQTYGFQQICNKGDKVCNFLAYYSDNHLRKEYDSLEQSLDLVSKISKISKNLYSYDAFIKLYQKLLGLRMLFDSFKRKDLELSIINLLKNEAGVSSLNKVSCMVTDFVFSQNFQNEKGNLLKSEAGLNMQVSILTSGTWQIHDSKNGNICVPPELLKATEIFYKIYSEQLPDRMLTWVFNYGRAIALVHFNEARHVLILNNYQMCIILYFQRIKFASAKLGELLENMKVEDEPAFNAGLMMLVKAKILLKEGNQVKIESKSERISFNLNFKHQSLKVRCFQLPRYIEKGSLQGGQLALERSHLIDAVIVKIMKSKRVVPYNQLIPEVQKMCKTFKADIGMIKKRIENCQEREFLERDPNDMNVLIYKA